MRGILGWGVHVPYRRLDRTLIAPVAGTGGGSGQRSVASYDEDTTTMGVEAARDALVSGVTPGVLWFATAAPAYLDRTNATAIHAALRLERSVPTYDVIGSTRSGLGALRAAVESTRSALVVTSDVRLGRAGSPEEASGGDAAAALLVGDDTDAPVLAEVMAWESLSEEFLDRWRVPGEPASRLWEERFGENLYVTLGAEALKLALDAAGIGAEDVAQLIVAGASERAAATVARSSGVDAMRIVDRLAKRLGNPGVAQPSLLLAAALEQSMLGRETPGQDQAPAGQTSAGQAGAGEPDAGSYIVLLSLADGADAVVLRTTAALASYAPARPVADQLARGAAITYGRYLAWRGVLDVEPPRRPEPARVSSPAAHRNSGWKFGFEAGGEAGDPHLPPRPDDTTGVAMAGALGTIVTFTVDKLSYSPSPPVIFAVVDFDGGGRLPVELTDADVDEIAIGGRVELTFRKLHTADGIHNYFWKGRPFRGTTTQRGEL